MYMNMGLDANGGKDERPYPLEFTSNCQPPYRGCENQT